MTKKFNKSIINKSSSSISAIVSISFSQWFEKRLPLFRKIALTQRYQNRNKQTNQQINQQIIQNSTNQILNQKNQPQHYEARDFHIATSDVSPATLHVIQTLQHKGFEAYVVGGGIRDLLLGKKPKDFDIATNATPEQVKRSFQRAFIIGKRFKLVHVHFRQEVIEVTTFRTLTHHKATVSFSNDRHHKPMIELDNEYGDSIQDDATRRDITINALYYDPISGDIFDFHQGMNDIKNREIRMIGDTKIRLLEDPVRITRIIRLATKLDLTISPDLLQMMAQYASLLTEVPPARLSEEWNKQLMTGASFPAWKLWQKLDINKLLFPHYQINNSLFEDILQVIDQRYQNNLTVNPLFAFLGLLWIHYEQEKPIFYEHSPIYLTQKLEGQLLNFYQVVRGLLAVKKITSKTKLHNNPLFSLALDFIGVLAISNPKYQSSYVLWKTKNEIKE